MDEIAALHRSLLEAWNRNDADAYAALFTEDGSLVGFDGSEVCGRHHIRAHLAGIFADHQVASYVGVIRDTRLIGADTVLLRAAVGMIPPGEHDLNPGANAVQSLVAVSDGDGGWCVAHFHNTPAAFHGRPEEAEALTAELRELIE